MKMEELRNCGTRSKYPQSRHLDGWVCCDLVRQVVAVVGRRRVYGLLSFPMKIWMNKGVKMQCKQDNLMNKLHVIEVLSVANRELG